MPSVVGYPPAFGIRHSEFVILSTPQSSQSPFRSTVPFRRSWRPCGACSGPSGQRLRGVVGHVRRTRVHRPGLGRTLRAPRAVGHGDPHRRPLAVVHVRARDIVVGLNSLLLCELSAILPSDPHDNASDKPLSTSIGPNWFGAASRTLHCSTSRRCYGNRCGRLTIDD